MDQEVARIWRPLAVSGRAQHSCQIALQRDLQLVAIGLEHDRLDERSNGVRRPCTALLALQSATEAADLHAIDVRHARVQQLRHLGSVEPGLQFAFPGLERQELVLDGHRGDTVLDGLNELADLPFNPGELGAGARESRAMLHAKPIQFAHVLAAEILEQVPAHQLLAERDKNSFFNLLAADSEAIRAGAARSRSEARQAIAPVHHVPATALRALRQAGEEVLRASRLIESLRIAIGCDAAHLQLARLHRIPQFVVDDSKPGNGRRHPLRRRVWPRDTLAGVRILHVSQTIPHEAPDVELVVQDSGTAGRIAVNGAGIPGCATRSWTAFCVQSPREGLGRHASGILAEDPEDHFRFGGDDLAVARGRRTIVRRPRHLVAVAETASGLSELDSAAQSASCFVGKVLQEERVHRALQADVQVRDVTLGERDDVHAGERKAFEESGGIFLVPAESIECFGEDNVEPPVQRITHQRLESGTQKGRARDRVIGELFNDRPPLASRELPTHPELVGNRRVALVVR